MHSQKGDRVQLSDYESAAATNKKKSHNTKLHARKSIVCIVINNIKLILTEIDSTSMASLFRRVTWC